MELDYIVVSTGSACSSAAAKPSHVLKAMGIELLLLNSAVRFSLGRYTTIDEINYAAHRVVTGVQRLCTLSPLA